MSHEEKVARWLRRIGPQGRRDFGVEIGAFKTPIPGLRPFYVDRFKEFANERCLADYWGDAAALPFRDHSLDYVASSHVLEHTANPVAALFEWARVTRHGGLLYMVVPDRRQTFDCRRELTSPEHMMEDFARGTSVSDGTHISDYLDNLDWARWNPNATVAENAAKREELRQAYTGAVAAGHEINIHFHVFESSNLIELIQQMNADPRRTATLEIVDLAEGFPASCPNGFLLVVRVRKPFRARMAGWLFRCRARGNADAALSAKAVPFAP
jgi:SAM-dependent methyltransferase